MKNKIISFLIVAVIGAGLILFAFTKKSYSKANEVYQVYLNGNKIGVITDKDDLYDLIDERQLEIKEKYGVDKVYPPNSFEIVKSYTYNDIISDVDEIYKQIENADDFTIKGYTITVHPTEPDEDGNIKPDIKINVLNRKIFNEAIMNFIYSFVGIDGYNGFINNTQPEIKDVGKKIEKMYFSENITIKESNISVKERIFTNSTELSQYLLFGDNIQEEKYTVQTGDTIEKVADSHKLSTQEFLVANPRYRSENSLLTIGDKVSIALIQPVLSLVCEMYQVSDVEQHYEKQTVYDNNKPYSYSQVTQKGRNGVTRITETYKSINGNDEQGEVLKKEVLVEPVNQITTKGKKTEVIIGNYVDDGGDWAWPTNKGYKISSGFKWRGGKHHDAIDIAYLPKNSPIYAAKGGTVIVAEMGTGSAWSLGNYVIIDHGNGIFTLYAHMNKLSVSAGQTVAKGKVLGGMGETGRATGVHLHFGAYVGRPYRGGKPFNPLELYK
ncbi:MAG: peptidoglycan DD-metalloendopeptidase family protein [Bacilli bacterium]|nr:peptidoglycan DD-metalloendopeptidase family protein [Bacilli bacterium]